MSQRSNEVSIWMAALDSKGAGSPGVANKLLLEDGSLLLLEDGFDLLLEQ